MLRAGKSASPSPQPLCPQRRYTRTNLCFWIILYPSASLSPDNEASETPAGACVLLWSDLQGRPGLPLLVYHLSFHEFKRLTFDERKAAA